MPGEDDREVALLRGQLRRIQRDLSRLKKAVRKLRYRVEALPARMPRSDAEGCLIGCVIPLLLFVAWPRLWPWVEWLWDLISGAVAMVVSTLFRR